MSNFVFNGHKLFYHLDRVDEFIKKKDCFPVYMEISPMGRCNHRCIFCAYDYIGYPDRKLETKRLCSFIDEASASGVKSILYAGEGEPLLHPDIGKILLHTKNKGVDIGLFTNGQFLKKDLARDIIPALTFIRFSFNGGTKENYSLIHNVKPRVFGQVLDNIQESVTIKREKNAHVDIGVQYVLLSENIEYLFSIIKTLKEIGVQYFVIKPFVLQNNNQAYRMKESFSIDHSSKVLDEAEKLSDENFKVVARRESFTCYGKRNYNRCFGTSFISVLNSAGDVAACLPYWDKEEFIFGSIYEKSFKDIWLGEKRRDILQMLIKEFDAKSCPPNCRPNAINEFLWELKNPSVKHKNFI